MHKLASTPITIDCFETDDYHSIVLNTDEQDPFLQKINVFNTIENEQNAEQTNLEGAHSLAPRKLAANTNCNAELRKPLGYMPP